MKSFAELFKKYRLRAEFETFSSFSNALAEKGYFYEESIFSHWQKGARLPTSRDVVLKIIAIFNERGAISTLRDANEFLESAKHGYLTEKEKEEFHFAKNYNPPFQVPSEIAHFIGREKILEKIRKEITAGRILLLYGPPGVGKTALAIKLGHLLQAKYPDGVLWYKVDSTNIMDILLSIARLFGEDISAIKDVEVRASIVRTLLSSKKLLLIFDNVTDEHTLKLLIPNSPTSSLIFTSQDNSLNIANKYISVPVATFTEEETRELFHNIFNKNFITKYVKQIIELSEKLGYLPLALHMAANYIKQSNVDLQMYIQQLNDESIDLHQMKYEDKNLFRAITISFNTLDQDIKTLFLTLGIFEGKDFSLEVVSFVNKLSESKTKLRLQKLMDISFVEESNNKRYRIHPLLKIFARKQLTDTSYYLRAAQYYEQLLARADEIPCMKVLRLEVDNIIYIFKQCYEAGYWDQVITLWNPIEKFLSDVNELKRLRLLTSTIDTSPKINYLQKIFTVYMLVLILYWTTLLITGLKVSVWNSLYSLLFTAFPFIGGIVGIYMAKSWGLFASKIGKAILFISLGSFSWGTGNIIWAYYNFVLNTVAPYPSLADLGYFPAYLFWAIGTVYLSKATGIKFSLQKIKSKMLWLAIPSLVLYFSYYFLLFGIERSFDSETPLIIFFDLYYPSMDIVILTVAFIIWGLSVNFFGGKYKWSLFAILYGFVFQYVGDFMFSYFNSINIYYNGGITDLMFSIGLYLISWGALSFYLTPKIVTKTK
jgi:energy-coupling factor transporter ATP-binding protein EcfA2